MENRDSKGRFTKGNPGGGRPKKQPTTRELLRTLSPQAVTCLGDLIHSDDEEIALKASFAILELSLEYDRNGKRKSTSDDYDDEAPIAEEQSIKNINDLRDFFAQIGVPLNFTQAHTV